MLPRGASITFFVLPNDLLEKRKREENSSGQRKRLDEPKKVSPKEKKMRNPQWSKRKGNAEGKRGKKEGPARHSPWRGRKKSGSASGEGEE